MHISVQFLSFSCSQVLFMLNPSCIPDGYRYADCSWHDSLAERKPGFPTFYLDVWKPCRSVTGKPCVCDKNIGPGKGQPVTQKRKRTCSPHAHTPTCSDSFMDEVRQLCGNTRSHSASISAKNVKPSSVDALVQKRMSLEQFRNFSSVQFVVIKNYKHICKWKKGCGFTIEIGISKYKKIWKGKALIYNVILRYGSDWHVKCL